MVLSRFSRHIFFGKPYIFIAIPTIKYNLLNENSSCRQGYLHSNNNVLKCYLNMQRNLRNLAMYVYTVYMQI